MQFLHCAAHLPLIANYRDPATRQASPICCLKRKLSLTLKGTVLLQSNNFYIVLRTLLYLQNSKICQVPVTPLPGKVSPNCRCYVSLPKRNHLSKKALTALMFAVFIYPPTQEFYPHRWLNNLIKMLCWICKLFFSISHRSTYVQAFHIASIYINSLENDSATQIYKRNIIANSCTQLYVCLSNDTRNVFPLFSVKYMGSCPLNRKLLWNSDIVTSFFVWKCLSTKKLPSYSFCFKFLKSLCRVRFPGILAMRVTVWLGSVIEVFFRLHPSGASSRLHVQ